MQTLLSRTATITDGQRAVVAELMTPVENLIGDPVICMPTGYGPQFALLGPAEPVDEPGDDD